MNSGTESLAKVNDVESIRRQSIRKQSTHGTSVEAFALLTYLSVQASFRLATISKQSTRSERERRC